MPLATGPLVPGSRHSVGTSSVRDLRAWVAQPPASVVAGSGAGCRPDDGAEPPKAEGWHAVTGGRPRRRRPALESPGWRDPRPGRAAAPPNPKTPGAHGGPHTQRPPHPVGHLAGSRASLGPSMTPAHRSPCCTGSL